MSPPRLSQITLTAFRSYASARLELGGGGVVLFGPNGAGKTNVLEAVSLLSPGKGLRGAAAGEIGRRGAKAVREAMPWSVAALIAGGEGEAPRRLGTGLELGAARRIVRLDGETVAAGRLAEFVRLVWLTPAQDRLFLEAASERRRFLDRLTFAAEPAHAGHAAAYDKASRERLRVLTDARDLGRPADPAWLDALEARLAHSGHAMAAARARTVAALTVEIEARGDRPFPRAALALEGEWSAPDAEADYAPRLRRALAAARPRDAAAARALTGPHRADLSVIHLETGRRAAEGSTGEQKALTLNLVLAQAARLSRRPSPETGGPAHSFGAESAPNPILLLDEVAAHLDARRRAALFDEITALGLQVFLTGTDRALFQEMEGRAQFVHVDAGRFDPSSASET